MFLQVLCLVDKLHISCFHNLSPINITETRSPCRPIGWKNKSFLSFGISITSIHLTSSKCMSFFSPKYFESSAKLESNSFYVHTHTWPIKQILILKSLQALCSQTFFIQSTAGIPSLGLILDSSRADRKCCQETNGFRGDKQYSCHCV